MINNTQKLYLFPLQEVVAAEVLSSQGMVVLYHRGKLAHGIKKLVGKKILSGRTVFPGYAVRMTIHFVEISSVKLNLAAQMLTQME